MASIEVSAIFNDLPESYGLNDHSLPLGASLTELLSPPCKVSFLFYLRITVGERGTDGKARQVSFHTFFPDSKSLEDGEDSGVPQIVP